MAIEIVQILDCFIFEHVEISFDTLAFEVIVFVRDLDFWIEYY